MYPHALQERNDTCNKRNVNAWTGHDVATCTLEATGIE